MLVLGWFDTTQHPQNLVGMVHVVTKFCPQVPPMRQGKTFTSLLNVRVNQLSISQKWLFWCRYLGWFDTPQHPQNLVGMGHVGTKFCPQVPSMRVWKKRPICWIKESNSWVLARNGYFGVGTWGGLTPPNTPKTWWGWFMWVPNFAHKSFPWDREKNWPMQSM